MDGFLQRLKQRKLVQWAIAYVAFAFALIQVLDVVSGSYGWPHTVMHIVFGLLVLGFVVVLVLAWYHGERGAQRISGPELLLIALVLAVGGGLLWHFARTPATNAAAKTIAPVRNLDAAQRNAGAATPDSAADAASSGLRTATTQATPIPAKSVAVLPFENLSTDKGNAYFADGMQDLILTKLADIGDLKVVSRTSTEKYKSHPDDLKTIGQQLGVATILEGSVQKAGKQVLINVQLIDAKTDSHIWAQSYQRTLDNIFGVEGEVAETVAKALNAKLTAEESTAVASVLTNDPQAYTLYLQAQYELDQFLGNDGQPADLLRADAYLRQAIAHDSGFAAAYAALARTELLIRADTVEATDATLKDVRAHAEKAIALQPDLATGHIALSRVLMDNNDLDGALRELQTAARLAPNDAYVQSRFSVLHVNLGDWDQALVDAGNALRLDPRSGGNYGYNATLYVALRRYDDARQVLERGLAISPHDQLLRSRLADLYLLLGDPAKARAQYAMLPPDARGRPAGMAYAWLLSRDYPEVLKAAEQIPHRNVWSDTGNRNGWMGLAATLLGDHARAQSALDQARQEVLATMSKHPGKLESQLAWLEMWAGNRKAAMQASDQALSSLTHLLANVKQSERKSPLSAAPDMYETRAEIFAHFGDAKNATDILRQLFETKGTGWAISVPELQLDPVWDPIRHDPAFQALLKKYATPTNASTAATGIPGAVDGH